MNLLLDTHSFLWALFTPDKLSKSAAQKIKSPDEVSLGCPNPMRSA